MNLTEFQKYSFCYSRDIVLLQIAAKIYEIVNWTTLAKPERKAQQA